MTTPLKPDTSRGLVLGTGPLEGYISLKLDPAKIVAWTEACEQASIRYGLGSKAPSLSAQPDQVQRIDCSGFARWVLFHATGGNFVLTDGSVNQHDQIDGLHFKPSDYSSCALSDGRVRIAFHSPNEQDEIGHVALFYMGRSYESYGGHGPGSRPHDTPVLERLMNAVYVLG